MPILKSNRNYSQIISAKKYNKLMNLQHKYIATADRFICTELFKIQADFDNITFLEVGGGPMRISFGLLQTLWDGNKPFDYTLIDIDEHFAKYSRRKVSREKLPIKIINGDINNYNLTNKINIAVSQGFHHHIDSGYLKHLKKILQKGGYYIISDEFLLDYSNEQERCENAVIWYSHIINNAISGGCEELAVEEAKTFLDDITVDKNFNSKSSETINLVLNTVNEIENSSNQNNLVIDLLQKLDVNGPCSNDITMNLSRGDYKISNKKFEDQVVNLGFKIKNKIVVGDNRKGNLTVYTLQV